MSKLHYRYIYGPVSSWRLGRSLGIDPISSRRKLCTFDCIYCQLGSARPSTGKRRVFVPAERVIKEIKSLPPAGIDYISFSGTGEPTLAKNLGQMVKAVRRLRDEKIAVLTNSSLIDRSDVQRDLSLVDFVIAKLDVSSQDLFRNINRPERNLRLRGIVKGIKKFKSKYKGRLGLQIMFIKENKGFAGEIAKIAKDINPDEVQINTPLRPCRVKPLSKKEISLIKRYFKGMKAVSAYDITRKKKTEPFSRKETLRRRGKI